MTNKEIKEVLALHQLWLDTATAKGKKANLTGANLRGANLEGADLTGADLRGAKVTLELSEACTLRKAKVSEGHLPWLTGRSSFGKELPTLTIKNSV